MTEPPNSSTGKLRSLLSAKTRSLVRCHSLGEDVWPYVNPPPWGNKTYLSTNCLHKNSPDQKTFICQSDTCGSVPRAYSAKRDRINPYQSPISNREKVRCPASTYIYSEARDRNPNKRSNLGVTQLYPVLELQGLMSYHNSKQTKTTEGWVRQKAEHAYNISHQKA